MLNKINNFEPFKVISGKDYLKEIDEFYLEKDKFFVICELEGYPTMETFYGTFEECNIECSNLNEIIKQKLINHLSL